jgi:dihydrofolate reductase
VARLIYSAISSLDGYVADERGRWGWCEPDEDVHRFLNEQEPAFGTHLYGRRTFQVMSAWQTFDVGAQPDHIRAFASSWREADKVVFSRTLALVGTPRTRLEREFDPESVRRMKESAQRDLSIGGPGLAAHALTAGLVDECRLFLAPVLVGGGKRALPDGLRADLELIAERRFESGFVHLRYRVAG